MKFVRREDAFRTLNILLYGRPKVGKTSGACTAPGPILHINAEGPDSVAFALDQQGDKVRSVEFTGRGLLQEIPAYLRGDGKDVATVVVDTIGAMYGVLLAAERSRDPRKSYGAVNDALLAFLTYLFAQPFNVVIVAHEKEVDDGEDTIFVPRIPGQQVLPFIEQSATVIGYVSVMVDEDEREHRVAQLVPGKGRTCGDRTNVLGKWREMDLTEWVAAIAAAQVVPEPEPEPEPEQGDPVDDEPAQAPRKRKRKQPEPQAAPEPEQGPEGQGELVSANES